jgi:hypothetical protein
MMLDDSMYLVWWMPYDSEGNCFEGFDFEDCCLIGVYSTHANAESAIERSRKLPGFSDYPEAFLIDEYVVDEDHWTSGMKFGQQN